MAKYTIYFKASAEKDLDKLDKIIGDRVEAKIDLLESNPYPTGFKKLKGESSIRIRVGDYRIIYEVDEQSKSVIIFKIGHRREVYRK
jgi:mRNA interferase RelE/StbE